MFCDWLFPVFLGVSHETAAVFLLFPKNCHDTEGKVLSAVKTEVMFYFYNKSVYLLLLWAKSFNEDKIVKDFNKKVQSLYIHSSTFVSAIYNFSLAGIITLYTPNQGTNREKYFNHIIYKARMPTLARNKHDSVHIFLHEPRLFYLPTEKVRVQSVKNGHKGGYSRADTMNNNINKRSKKFSMEEN